MARSTATRLTGRIWPKCRRRVRWDETYVTQHVYCLLCSKSDSYKRLKYRTGQINYIFTICGDLNCRPPARSRRQGVVLLYFRDGIFSLLPPCNQTQVNELVRCWKNWELQILWFCKQRCVNYWSAWRWSIAWRRLFGAGFAMVSLWGSSRSGHAVFCSSRAFAVRTFQ